MMRTDTEAYKRIKLYQKPINNILRVKNHKMTRKERDYLEHKRWITYKKRQWNQNFNNAVAQAATFRRSQSRFRNAPWNAVGYTVNQERHRREIGADFYLNDGSHWHTDDSTDNMDFIP